MTRSERRAALRALVGEDVLATDPHGVPEHAPLYIEWLPKAIPPGWVLRHNVKPPTQEEVDDPEWEVADVGYGLGVHGFRAWLEPEDDHGGERCDCGWA